MFEKDWGFNMAEVFIYWVTLAGDKMFDDEYNAVLFRKA
jgi:hypothetical protein